MHLSAMHIYVLQMRHDDAAYMLQRHPIEGDIFWTKRIALRGRRRATQDIAVRQLHPLRLSRTAGRQQEQRDLIGIGLMVIGVRFVCQQIADQENSRALVRYRLRDFADNQRLFQCVPGRRHFLGAADHVRGHRHRHDTAKETSPDRGDKVVVAGQMNNRQISRSHSHGSQSAEYPLRGIEYFRIVQCALSTRFIEEDKLCRSCFTCRSGQRAGQRCHYRYHRGPAMEHGGLLAAGLRPGSRRCLLGRWIRVAYENAWRLVYIGHGPHHGGFGEPCRPLLDQLIVNHR
ncbi:Uncharacterised protein [Mycobacteroides abscessus subsp. abscessus]|nr:Uncharacterised protein [Mycobacteroides abscessus subsp. abscessus]